MSSRSSVREDVDDGDVQTDATPFTRPHQAEDASGARRKQQRRAGAGSDEDEDDSDQGEELFQDAEEEQREEELSRRAGTALRIADDDGGEGTRVAAAPSVERAQRNIVINTVQGDLHIGPQLVQNFHGVGGAASYKRRRSQLSHQEKEHIMACAKCKRQVTKLELSAVSGRIGSDWKAVGNGLKLQPYLVDAIESDVDGPLRDKVEKMLLKWLAIRNEKATVARLTKALFNHCELDAIKAIKP